MKDNNAVFPATIPGPHRCACPALKGCHSYGATKEEALEALKDAAQAYIEVLLEKGRSIPVAKGVETRDALAVAVTV